MTAAQDTNCSGGLLAITLGASLGGVLFDMRGYRSTLAVSAVLLCGAACLALKAGREAVATEPARSPILSTVTEIQI